MTFDELKTVLIGLYQDDKSFSSIILNSIFDGVYIADDQKKILFWNKGAEQITGYKTNYVLGRKCSDDILNHVDKNGNRLCETNQCLIERVFSSQTHVKDSIYTLRKDGSRFYCQTNMSPVKDKDGKVIAAIEVFRDISAEEEVKKLQKKIQKQISHYLSEETYQNIVSSVSSGKINEPAEELLTVVFIDIVKFTTFSENNMPDVVINMLNLFFSKADRVIYNHNGYVDKFIGDSIFAVFIDANDAIKASIEILNNVLQEVNKELEYELKIRIGMDSGVVIKGDVGSKYRKDMTVIGDTVNTASRIEQICPVNSILITGATYLLVQNQKNFVFLKNITLRGKTKSVPTYLYKSSGIQ